MCKENKKWSILVKLLGYKNLEEKLVSKKQNITDAVQLKTIENDIKNIRSIEESLVKEFCIITK